MTTLFYAPPAAFRDGEVELPEDEARHAGKVLRHSPGDEIEVVDGAGGRHTVRLTVVERQRVRGEVLRTARDMNEPSYRLTVGLATLKNAARFETFAEKAVELGVSAITPLATARSERQRVRPARLQNILIAAMKQSGRCRLPALGEPTELEDVLRQRGGAGLICHEAAGPEHGIGARLAAGVPPELTILVGPEGGFSDEEVAHAVALGWQLASLGSRRLRAETAAITACAAVMLAAER
jgi:16S rRNA (uracil1498-N3)-methyltransferase